MKKKPNAKSDSKSKPAKAAKKATPVKGSASKKTPPAKPVVKTAKPAAKAVPAKSKIEAKKPAAPVKGAKVVAKPAAKVPEAKGKPVIEIKAPKKAEIEAKPSKKESKKPQKPAKGKKDEVELEDDFIPDDGMGHDEIGEYEEELKAVEEEDVDVDGTEDDEEDDKIEGEEEIFLTDAEGRRYCRARDCDQIAAVEVYCRYHYLMFWKKIQVRKRILQDGKLEKYVEELTARYPDKFLEMIRRDLRTEKEFLAAIAELEIDESAVDNDFEEESGAFIEEVRGGVDTGAVDDDEY